MAWPPNDQKLKEIMKEQGGFCTHSSILFLTWHRPYLAVFEVRHLSIALDRGTHTHG